MITLALSLLVSAPFHVDVKLADPVTTANTFELAIARGAIAVQNAKTVKHANGDVLYFVSNATGMDSDRDFPNGPIAHLRTRELPRGYAIVLTPRSETSVAMRGGVIVAKAVHAAPVSAPIVAKAEEPKADNREPIVDSRTPIADSREATADNRTPISRLPIAASREPRADVRAQPINDTHSSPLRNFGLLAALVAAGGAIIVYGKKRKTTRAGGEPAGIELLAVKALGGKQRLAVVDACGDRLLIATSEQGVQLLSKLEGGTGIHKVPADFMATLAQAESAGPVPTTHVTPVNTSRDLAGLVHLRARRATWTSAGPLV